MSEHYFDKRFSENDKASVFITEASSWYIENQQALRRKIVPLFIIQRRCAYVASLIKHVSTECSFYCKLASEASFFSDFERNCARSIECGNQWVKRRLEEEYRYRGGIL